ncbi:hypothetical protein COU80_03545 [Candidatus Peregrinibacteria bacterium CG10_big_fil_rev_8_21_14_0_10_55_24]|nr:MAG: hypothetical protein COU80_03545 [Candidatus Peregrinibacteria bacterium CG10_big_fil_rev_8_21_14_0_10_55_24]
MEIFLICLPFFFFLLPMHAHSTPEAADAYYQRFAGTNFVTKISGSLVEQPAVLEGVLHAQQTFLRHQIGCVLVHGGGKQLSRALQGSKKHPETQLRVTPRDAIVVLENEIAQISREVASLCEQISVPCEVLPHTLTHAGRRIGHGETGEITDVDATMIREVLNDGKLAILPFGGIDEQGRTLNVNADENAWQTAAAIRAAKLNLLTNENGILVPGKNGTMVRRSFLDIHDLVLLLRKRKADGGFVISEGMVPKVEACLQALAHGVEQVHILKPSGEELLEEVLSRTGSQFGTLIERSQPLELIFPAQEAHLNGIESVRRECSTDAYRTPISQAPYIKPLSGQELTALLPRTLVIEHNGVVVATCYFDSIDGTDAALLGGFAVGESSQDSGYGEALLEAALERVHEAGNRSAVSITAAENVKRLFGRYGEKLGAYTPWQAHLLTRARGRYGEDAHLVDLYAFPLEQQACAENLS